MKKVFYLLIIVLGLVSCSTDDDYCGNEYYEAGKLRYNGFPLEEFKIEGLNGDSFTVIRSEGEFQDRVEGAQYHRGEINFRRDDLIIGQVLVTKYYNVISSNPLFKESCRYGYANDLQVIVNVSHGGRVGYVTYHAIVPKLHNDNIRADIMVNYLR